MRLRVPTVRELVAALGGAFLLLGLVLAFAPTLLPGGIVRSARDVESAVPAWIVLVVLSGLAFAYALYRYNRTTLPSVDRLVDTVDDGDVAHLDLDLDGVAVDPDRPGRHFDYAVARTVARLERDPNAATIEAEQIREELRRTLVAVHSRSRARKQWHGGSDGQSQPETELERDPGNRTGEGPSSEESGRSGIEAAIEDGSWTDDPVAGHFLGGPGAPEVSRWRRLYAWFYPARAFERRVERVVAEIERQASVGRDGGPPERARDVEGEQG